MPPVGVIEERGSSIQTACAQVQFALVRVVQIVEIVVLTRMGTKPSEGS
jgi:hypothetical protein